MELGNRLKAVANLVPRNKRIADIGTDHAYLPVYLAARGFITGAVASDNKEGPCQAARKTIAQYHLEQRIEVRQGDGLLTIHPDEVEVIVMAGMGGLTMLSILDQGMAVLNTPTLTHLVLQPQTDSDAVRRWAEQKGWEICQEDLAQEGTKLYEMFVLTPNKHYVYPGPSYEVGSLLITHKHPLLKKRLEKLIKEHRAALQGMEQGARGKLHPQYAQIKNKLEKVEEIYNENYRS